MSHRSWHRALSTLAVSLSLVALGFQPQQATLGAATLITPGSAAPSPLRGPAADDAALPARAALALFEKAQRVRTPAVPLSILAVPALWCIFLAARLGRSLAPVSRQDTAPAPSGPRGPPLRLV